jgi:hypothetical protein
MGFFGKVFRSVTKGVSDVVTKPVASIGNAIEVSGKAVSRAADSVGLRPVGHAIAVASAQVNRSGQILAKPVDILLDLGPTAIARSAVEIAQGERIDRAFSHLVTRRVNAVRDVLPYVQTAMSFVPGVGTGLSGVIGAANALSQGKTIDQAFIEAAKSMIHGGPLAQQVFAVAVSAAQGKPFATIALDALPIPPGQRQWVDRAVSIGTAVAHGKPVDAALYNEALGAVSGELGGALQAAVTIGKAQALQEATRRVADNAGTIRSLYQGASSLQRQAQGYRNQASHMIGTARQVSSQPFNLGRFFHR